MKYLLMSTIRPKLCFDHRHPIEESLKHLNTFYSLHMHHVVAPYTCMGCIILNFDNFRNVDQPLWNIISVNLLIIQLVIVYFLNLQCSVRNVMSLQAIGMVQTGRSQHVRNIRTGVFVAGHLSCFQMSSYSL